MRRIASAKNHSAPKGLTMDSTSRYSAVTRRAFLGGLSATAIVATVGCAAGTSTPSAPSSSAASSTASASASATAAATSGASTVSSGTELPASARAGVSWTFASSGGGSRNPYMAVWIEDAEGHFVKTVALYHKASGDNWLNSLNAWYASSSHSDTTTSGTVPAGTFTAVWDGSAADGGRAAQGAYYVCVESAVEHGSESLVRQQVTFGTKGAQTTLTPAGDITAAAVDYTV